MSTWINQSSAELLDDDRTQLQPDEFVVEFPSYDASPIYLIDSDLKETVISKNFSIIELINDSYTSLSAEVVVNRLPTKFDTHYHVYDYFRVRLPTSVSNMFILSLAIADLIVGAIVMPISSTYILTHDWIFGTNFCQFWILTDYTASTASILNILILSLDRYWSIKNPLQYLRKRTKKRALAMICIVWLISLSWALPILFWHTWYNPDGRRKHPDTVCETEFSDNIIFKLTSSFVNFIVPIVLMMGLYAKIFLEIKRRGKLNIGRYSSHNPKSLSKAQEQSNLPVNNDSISTATQQTSIKQSKSFRLKERLTEKLSLRDDKLRKENSIREVSFSAQRNLNKKDNRCRATWNGTNAKRKMLQVDPNGNQNVIPKIDLRIECDQSDQVSNSLTKNKEKLIESNGIDCKEKIEENARRDEPKDNEKESTKSGLDKETASGKQKYQQLTILTAGTIESQLKELRTVDNVKVEVQIVTTQDEEENETCEGDEDNGDEINDKEVVVVDEKSDSNKNAALVDACIEKGSEQHANKLSVKKWFLLPKVTVYLQKKNLQLDRKRRKGKLRNNKKKPIDCSIQEDDSSLSVVKAYGCNENEVASSVPVKGNTNHHSELKSTDSVTDSFNQKTRKRKAFRSLLWLRKMAKSDQQNAATSFGQKDSLEAPTIASKKRIENEETGSLSFDFSSSVPRSLEDLPTSPSLMHQSSTSTAVSARRTNMQSRLLPFSCSSSSLRVNRTSVQHLRNPAQPHHHLTQLTTTETSASRLSLINQTLNKNTLAKSTINLPTSISPSAHLTEHNEPANVHCLSINRATSAHLNQPNHSLSLHLPSTSSTSVNQNSFHNKSSGHLNTQSNQSSFYLGRIESSRLRQEKKAAQQLGLIMGGFLICWLPYIIVYILSAACQCIDNTTHTIAIWLGYINSSLNPVLYFMGPNSSRFKAAFRKLLLRKPVPRHLMDHPIHNGKLTVNPQLMNAPGLTFHNTTLTTNSINQRMGSVHTRLSRTTSNKSQMSANIKYDFNRTINSSKIKRNKPLNYSLREINNNTFK